MKFHGNLALWEAIEPLLPEEPPKPRGGRPRIDDRAVLTGILFVLKSGIPWEMLPQEMGCGSGMTCWRRLKEWHEAGVWEELHRTLLDRLGKAGQIDWQRASLDSASVAAPRGAKEPARIRRIRERREAYDFPRCREALRKRGITSAHCSAGHRLKLPLVAALLVARRAMPLAHLGLFGRFQNVGSATLGG